MITSDLATPQTGQPVAEKRVTLHHITWAAYEQILDALGNQRSALLNYYKGLLEIMTPLEAHEHSSKLIGKFVEILTEELDLNLKSMGSTTLRRSNLQVGAEPDQGFYIANEPLVRGKAVDLNVDPPPDLVLEVDITHTEINKNALYAEMGVREFWQYDGKVLTIYQLKNGQYQEVETSPTFAGVQKANLYQFLNECAQQGETQAKRNFRSWIRQQI